MYLCFECKEGFNSLDILKIHFKYRHMFPTNYNYKCGQSECHREFTSLRILIKHLTTCHNKENFDENMDEPNNTSFTTICNKSSKTIIPLDSCPQSIDVSEVLKKISQDSLVFVSKLHSYNNLSNSIITDILHELSENIRKIFSIVKQVVLPEIKMEKVPVIKNILDICANPFININSDYKVVKCLQEHNLYKPPIQFSINESITEVIKKGITKFEKKKSRVHLCRFNSKLKKFSKFQICCIIL